MLFLELHPSAVSAVLLLNNVLVLLRTATFCLTILGVLLPRGLVSAHRLALDWLPPCDLVVSHPLYHSLVKTESLGRTSFSQTALRMELVEAVQQGDVPTVNFLSSFLGASPNGTELLPSPLSISVQVHTGCSAGCGPAVVAHT